MGDHAMESVASTLETLKLFVGGPLDFALVFFGLVELSSFVDNIAIRSFLASLDIFLGRI
jgi:hypothetical protein